MSLGRPGGALLWLAGWLAGLSGWLDCGMAEACSVHFQSDARPTPLPSPLPQTRLLGRFGVKQRGRLLAKASPAPHVLHMTATPIPRTQALIDHGDMTQAGRREGGGGCGGSCLELCVGSVVRHPPIHLPIQLHPSSYLRTHVCTRPRLGRC